jgi:prefoldin alpha subunit
LTAPRKEDQFRRIVYELQLMDGSVQLLQERMQILSAALADLRLAQQSLSDLKNVSVQTPILIPVGGGTFVNAELGEMKKVIVGVGADVSVEMELDKAISDVSSRLEEVEKAQAAVEQQLTQIVAQMQSHQEVANRLSAELQGEAKRV